ncbi:unannotated protein [freshwater metagenome]|uniref:Unannotated protein n=1 Tax=freshwater metagenome TaxID=449393 RepID=A0A6J6WAC1_9ZZZZ
MAHQSNPAWGRIEGHPPALQIKGALDPRGRRRQDGFHRPVIDGGNPAQGLSGFDSLKKAVGGTHRDVDVTANQMFQGVTR